jgi:ankyrin repeat protein
MNRFCYFILFLFCINNLVCGQEAKQTPEEDHWRILKDRYHHALDVLKTETHGPLCSQLTQALHKTYGWTDITPLQKPAHFASLIRAVEKTIQQYKVLIPKQVIIELNELNTVAKKKKKRTGKIVAGVVAGTAAFLTLAALFIHLKLFKKTTGGSTGQQNSSATQPNEAPTQEQTLTRIPHEVPQQLQAPTLRKTNDAPNSIHKKRCPNRLVAVGNEGAQLREELDTGAALRKARNTQDAPSWIRNTTFSEGKATDCRRLYTEISFSHIQSCINSGNSNQTNNQGSTPLITVIEDIRLLFNLNTPIENVEAKKIITYLIESGADINHQNNFGLSALHYACWYEQYWIVNLLLNKGASPNLESKNDHLYPLDLILVHAHKDQNHEFIDHLHCITKLCSVMSPETKECRSHSPFVSALFFSDAFRSIEILCDNGFDFNKVDPISGVSPLEYAIAERRLRSILVFIKKRALIDDKSIELFTTSLQSTPFYTQWYDRFIKLPRAHTTTVDTEVPVVVYASPPPTPQINPPKSRSRLKAGARKLLNLFSWGKKTSPSGSIPLLSR